MAVDGWVITRIEKGLCPRTANAENSALRRFYSEAMGQPEKVEVLRCRKVPDRQPRSIPEAEAEILIEGINDLRYRTATLSAFCAGLRISEEVALRVGDIGAGTVGSISIAARAATNARRVCPPRHSRRLGNTGESPGRGPKPGSSTAIVPTGRTS